MKSLEHYHELRTKLEKNQVLDPIDSVVNCDLLNKSKYTLIAICHQMIHDLAEGDLKNDTLFPFIMVSPTQIGTGMMTESEIEEADRKNLMNGARLISAYDFIKHVSH